MNSTEAKRYFREMCGEYRPTETAPEKRFILEVDDYKVPIFITKEHIAVYPQVRITPFITDITYHKHQKYTSSFGDESEGELPDIEYKRTRTDSDLREARFQLDIFTKEPILLSKIRDELVSRWDDFLNTNFADFGPDLENWTLYNSIQHNTAYDTSIEIIRVIDETTILKKCTSISEVENTTGSWFLDDTGLYVNPLTKTSNLTFTESINGKVFYDGYMASEKGFKKKITIKTSHDAPDEDPDMSRWIMEVVIRFKDMKEKNVGRTFSSVVVNEPELN